MASAKKLNMKRHLSGVIQDLSRHYFFHIGKKIKQSFWRSGGTHAEKSAKFGQNGLCMSADISKKAVLFFFQYEKNNAKIGPE